MQTGYAYNSFSDEEIREIAQALRESDPTAMETTVSESELREIINSAQEYKLCDTAGKDTQQIQTTENPAVNIAKNDATGSKLRNIISDEEVDEIRSALEEGDLCKATEKITQSLNDIENASLNIAVTGELGSGKSTFVNVIRGLDDDDGEDAAKTGVTETTMEPKAYQHLKFKNVTIWDLPGNGSPNFKPDDYLRAVKFDQYDFFIIMSSERFRYNDMELAKAIKSMGKKFYFVRNKVDSDMHASQQRRKKSYNEENILKEIRDNCMETLKKGDIHDAKVFLLSCFDLSKYDFNKMQETLEQELPSQKRHAFMLSLPNISLQILNKKKTALRKQIWMWATLSCGVAAVPIPGLSVACDVGILMVQMKKYRDAFGLDQKSLKKLAKRFDKDVNELKSVIKSSVVITGINKELVIKLLTKGAMGAVMIAEYFISNIPVIGSIAAGGISFATTYYTLYSFLDNIAEDAVRVLQKALDSPV